jgi:hypothetical protein
LADVALRSGQHYSRDRAAAVSKTFEPWGKLVDAIEQHLARNNVDLKKSKFQLGPLLEFDSKTEKFVGDGAQRANKFLRREYRRKFEVEEIT